MTAVIANTLFLASNRIHADSIQRIMHAPMSFFDTTPLGRIMNRLTKDIDTIDNTLGDNFRQFSLQISTTAGTLIIIAIVDPVFLAPVAVIGSLYFMLARYYQKSALMFKVSADIPLHFPSLRANLINLNSESMPSCVLHFTATFRNP